MAGPVSTKTEQDQGHEQTTGRSFEPASQLAATGPQADLLTLQDDAGNRAVSQLFSPGHSAVDSQLPSQIRDGLRGPGQPLDEATRAYMETTVWL